MALRRLRLTESNPLDAAPRASSRMTPSDLVTRLRRWTPAGKRRRGVTKRRPAKRHDRQFVTGQRLRDRAYSGLPDPLSEQAADEIELLRLTDAEREAVEWCIFQQATPQRIAVALRGLLDRMR